MRLLTSARPERSLAALARSSQSDPARMVAFLAVGAGSLLLDLLFVAWVPLLPTNVYRPLLDLGKITGGGWPAVDRYVFLVGGLFLLYGLGYRLLARGAAGPRAVFGFAVAFCLALLLAYPATAADVFGYVAQGRLLALRHVNPFTVAPSAYPLDSIIPYLAFPTEPSQYGPLWALLGAGITWVAGASLLGEVLLYKLVASAAHLASAALVLAIGRRLTDQPRRALLGAYLFAWNPLLLWEMAGNAHNDGVMALWMLAGLWLLVQGRATLALPAVMLGALVKLPAVVLLPLLALLLWRRQRGAALLGGLLAAGLAVALYAPFWAGPRTVTALSRTSLFSSSLASSLMHLLLPSYGELWAMRLAHAITLALLVAVLVPICWRAWRGAPPLGQLGLCYAALLAFLLLGVSWFQAWYVVWPFALGAALPVAARHREVALFSLGAMASYVIWSFLWGINGVPGGPDVARHVAYALIVGPLLLGWAASALGRWLSTNLRPALARRAAESERLPGTLRLGVARGRSTSTGLWPADARAASGRGRHRRGSAPR